MVEQLTAHTWGLQMLFPFFALTGLKFVFPQLVTIPDFVTKTELTTLTMFYDAYYDFGIHRNRFVCVYNRSDCSSSFNSGASEEKSDDVYVLWTDCDLSGACLFYDLVQ